MVAFCSEILAESLGQHPRRHTEVDPHVHDVPDAGAPAADDQQILRRRERADLVAERAHDLPSVVDRTVAPELITFRSGAIRNFPASPSSSIRPRRTRVSDPRPDRSS